MRAQSHQHDVLYRVNFVQQDTSADQNGYQLYIAQRDGTLKSLYHASTYPEFVAETGTTYHIDCSTGCLPFTIPNIPKYNQIKN